MQINFTGHHIKITPALKKITKEKFNKIERHFSKIRTINIVFNVEKLRQIVEATVLLTGEEVHAHSESEDMYTAIDALIEKLDRQLTKHKEISIEHRDHREKDRDYRDEDRDR